MTRTEALQVKEGDSLRCEFFKGSPTVEILGINPSASSQERITFQVNTPHGYIWLDAGWFALPAVAQLELM